MCILRSRVGVAVANGKLYAIGGYDGTIHRLSAVECYDPQVQLIFETTLILLLSLGKHLDSVFFYD